MSVRVIEQNHKRVDLLGVKVSAVNLKLAYEQIVQWVKNHTQTYVCVAPVSTLVDCQKDAKYRAVVNQAGMITPDGMPVVWLGKGSGDQVIERTYGPDLMHYTFDHGQQAGLRHFLFGGSPQSLAELQLRLKASYPRAQIVGAFSPPMRAQVELENAEVLDLIRSARPDILWIGLGSPKQDYWMDKHRQHLDVPVMIAVGAAFDFLAGIKKQAPRWMQRSGLEWFFRLISEPQRLWKRYLIGNSLFVLYVVKSWFVRKTN